jgi:hypothetical protein
MDVPNVVINPLLGVVKKTDVKSSVIPEFCWVQFKPPSFVVMMIPDPPTAHPFVSEIKKTDSKYENVGYVCAVHVAPESVVARIPLPPAIHPLDGELKKMSEPDIEETLFHVLPPSVVLFKHPPIAQPVVGDVNFIAEAPFGPSVLCVQFIPPSFVEKIF